MFLSPSPAAGQQLWFHKAKQGENCPVAQLDALLLAQPRMQLAAQLQGHTAQLILGCKAAFQPTSSQSAHLQGLILSNAELCICSFVFTELSKVRLNLLNLSTCL